MGHHLCCGRRDVAGRGRPRQSLGAAGRQALRRGEANEIVDRILRCTEAWRTSVISSPDGSNPKVLWADSYHRGQMYSSSTGAGPRTTTARTMPTTMPTAREGANGSQHVQPEAGPRCLGQRGSRRAADAGIGARRRIRVVTREASPAASASVSVHLRGRDRHE